MNNYIVTVCHTYQRSAPLVSSIPFETIEQVKEYVENRCANTDKLDGWVKLQDDADDGIVYHCYDTNCYITINYEEL